MARDTKTDRMARASEEVKQEYIDAVLEASNEGRIACERARKLAEELGISKTLMGAAVDVAGVRVVDCGLGCF